MNFEIKYSLQNIENTAIELIQKFDLYRIFCFTGNLGTGKTTLITNICKALGSVNDISSPTFSIINEYSGLNSKIFHFDFYRLKNHEEAMDIGFEEYIYSGNYCFIEWPEKVKQILPFKDIVNCELCYLSMNERMIKAWTN